MQLGKSARSTVLYLAWVALVIALGIALRWRAVEGAFLADDYDHYAMRAGIYPVARGPFNMFDFVGNDPVERKALLGAGRLPWWTYPEIHLSVLRPLASALIALDFRLFGPAPTPFHLHSMLWWVALVIAVAALLRRLLPLPAAGLGVALYALDESHGLPLCWIANRSAIVAIALCTAALWAHVAWRQGALRHGWALSLGLLSLGLLAGEHAFAVLAYFAAFELWGVRDSFRRRVLSLAPVALLGTAYLFVRALLGYGISGSGFYIDPLTTPLRYAVAATLRLPLLLGDLLFGLAAEWHYSEPPFRPWLLHAHALPASWLAIDSLHRAQLALGFVAALVLGFLLWRLGRSPWCDRVPAARFLLLGGLLSLAPMCSTLPMSRLCLGAAIGVDAVLAVLLASALEAARWGSSLGKRIAHGAFAAALIAVHGWGAAVRGHEDVDYYTYRSYLEEAWVLEAEIDDDAITEQEVMVIAARDWTSQWALPYVRRLHGLPLPRSSDLLSGAMENPHTLVRVADTVLDLEIEGPPQSPSFTGSVYRPEDAPFHGGEKFAGARFDVQVLEAASGQPTRIRFTFPRAVDDPEYLFLYPRSDGLVRVVPPPVGGTMSLPEPALPHFPSAATEKTRRGRRKPSDHK